MTNNDVVKCMSSGIMGVSSRVLQLNYAYTVTKFKSLIDKAFKAWQENYEKLLTEVGIDNAEIFDAQHNELVKKSQSGILSDIEKEKLNEQYETISRLNALRNKLGEEKVKINVSPIIPYEDWITLKEANQHIKSGNAECLELVEGCLENILWGGMQNDAPAGNN